MGIEVSQRKNAVSQAINKMGESSSCCIEVSFLGPKRLALYRSKDVIEKGFDVLKNNIELMPANLRTNSSLGGYLFIAFFALILRMKLMNDAELNKKYSVEGLLTELEKIKVMILPDGEKILIEITKKQREILDALHMCAAVLDKSLQTASRRPFWSGTKISQESISAEKFRKVIQHSICVPKSWGGKV